MLGAEEDHLPDHVVEIGRAERAGKAYPRGRVVTGRHKVDVSLAVDLSAGEEEHVDPTLPGAVEQFARAVGEEVVLAALQERDVGTPVAIALPREQRGSRRDRRGIADRDA